MAGSEERLTRFDREARILASLNHPGIATLHGLETSSQGPLLVMELVEGETLAARLSRGSLPIEEVFSLFRQIAEALESAHGKGILHRDLKPSNIMITRESRVKLLDFGLAKAFLDEVPETGASQSPTLTKGTAHGVILGTASYMSPEQARGKSVDRRTDIWAFGAVLFEALSGRKAFTAETVTDTLAAVVRGEPDFSALPRETPARVRDLVARCLRKDANQRVQHIGDARIALEEARAIEPEAPVRSRPPWLVPATTALAAAGLTWFLARPSVEPAKVTRSVLNLPAGSVLSREVAPSIAISPDGRTVAFVAQKDGVKQLYVRPMDGLEAKPIAGTEGAFMPIFSPDSQWLGFFSRGQLMKVPLSGGAPASIAEILATDPRGASWGDDGKIVLSVTSIGGLTGFDSGSGEMVEITRRDPKKREKSYRLADVLPEGRSILFTLGTGDIGTWEEASIAVFSRDTGAYRVLVEGGSNARYSASGHLLYARDGAILALPFDRDKLQTRGTPVTVVEDAATSPIFGHAEFALSREGTLVYAGGGVWGTRHRVVAVDRDGRVETLIDEELPYLEALVSPDGRSLALSIDGANPRIWLYDMARGTMTRLAAGFENLQVVWTPGGRSVTFVSSREGPYNIFQQRVDGTGGAEVLLQNESDVYFPNWSPDGTVLAYVDEMDIWAVSAETGERTLLVGGDSAEWRPEFSPDGRWLAYASDESGRSEIYLRPFPDMRQRWQVSTDGGDEPRFRRDGRELFYRNGDKLMAVPIESEGEPLRRKPTLLFEKRFATTTFDVASDGRFIFIEDMSTSDPPTELVLVQNFFAELERLAPVPR